MHHHFPAKSDLAVAVVEQSRSAVVARAAEFDEGALSALEALRGYADHWERRIGEGGASFCPAAVLAAEAPSLSPAVSAVVRAHVRDISTWLAAEPALGRQQGAFEDPPEGEVGRFMAAVYGAMLAARIFGEPERFRRMVRAVVRQLTRQRPAAGSSS